MAEAVKAYALAHGLSERQGRRDRNANLPRWQEWLRRWSAAAAVKLKAGQPPSSGEVAAVVVMSPAGQVAEPGEADDETVAGSQPEQMVRHHWKVWQEARKAWTKALQGGDILAANAYGQAAIKAQEAYYKAQAKLEAWQLEQRRVVPMAEVQAMLAEFLQPIANLIDNIPAELAPVMNPSDPGFAMRQGQGYREQRIIPAVKRLLEAFEGYTGRAA